MGNLVKLAGDLQSVLRTSADHLTKLANAHADLLARNGALTHELAAMKLARRMEQRGIEPGLEFEAKVAKLLETPFEKLATMEQAVELATGGFRLGQVQADEPVRDMDGDGGRVPDVLDSYIASQAALT